MFFTFDEGFRDVLLLLNQPIVCLILPCERSSKCVIELFHFTFKISWRPVIWGIGLQFVFGLLILRTNPGRVFFKWMGDHVMQFLIFSDSGAKFILGDLVSNRYVAFKVVVFLFKSNRQSLMPV